MDEVDNSKSLKRTSLDLDETDPATSSINDDSTAKKLRVDHEDATTESGKSDDDASEQGTDRSSFKGVHCLWIAISVACMWPTHVLTLSFLLGAWNQQSLHKNQRIL